jgi:hypothetical protein
MYLMHYECNLLTLVVGAVASTLAGDSFHMEGLMIVVCMHSLRVECSVVVVVVVQWKDGCHLLLRERARRRFLLV